MSNMVEELKKINWDINQVGGFPYYFLALSLTGDTANALQMIQSNLNNKVEFKDKSKLSWVETLENILPNYIPFIEKTYPIERIDFLKNFKNICSKIKSSDQKIYIDSLKTVKIGQLNWTNTYLLPEKINISPKALLSFDQYFDHYWHDKMSGQEINYIEHKNTVIIIDYLNQEDFKKIEPAGWRLPTIKEIKDLFSRNLSDYRIDINKLSAMDGDRFSSYGGYLENRYLCKGNDGKIVVYNVTKDEVNTVIRGSVNKSSGLCLLLKIQ
jgi:hypothetical protein